MPEGFLLTDKTIIELQERFFGKGSCGSVIDENDLSRLVMEAEFLAVVDWLKELCTNDNHTCIIVSVKPPRYRCSGCVRELFDKAHELREHLTK